MEKIKFAILGGGKRSEYFVRVAKALPDVFDFKGSWVRNPEKAEAFSKRMGTPTHTDFDKVMELDVDFYVIAMPWVAAGDYCKKLMNLGKNIFVETPAGPDINSLTELYELREKTKVTIGVADEYHLQPYHEAVCKIVGDGVIGTPHYAYISMMHGYHFANIARKVMGIGMEKFKVTGKEYTHQLATTADRYHEFEEKPIENIAHHMCRLEFESGKVVQYDFSNVLYSSLLRSTELCVWGDKGEIRGNTVLFLNENNEATREEITRYDLGHYSSLQEKTHKGFSFCGKWVYRNPFLGSALIDDEIAVAAELVEMKKYIDTGSCRYTYEDALQDAYISFLMTQSWRTGETLTSEDKPWH